MSATWLSSQQCHNCDQHGFCLEPTSSILLYPWKRHFMALSHAWQSSKFQSYLYKIKN